MKGAYLRAKVLIGIFTLLCLGVSARAVELEAGLSCGYGLSLTNDFVPGVSSYNGSLNHLALGGYFDFAYVRLSLIYITNLGNPKSTPAFTGDLRTTQVGYSVLLKFPVVIKSLTLWSGVGAGFLTTIMLDTNGDGVNDKDPNAALNDLYLLFAFGAEFKVANLITIGPGFTLNYNLTPAQYSNEPAGSTHTQVFFQFTLMVGFAFEPPKQPFKNSN